MIYSLFRPVPVRGRDAAVAHFVRVNSTFKNLAMTLAHAPTSSDGRVLAEFELTGAFTGELTWEGVTNVGAGQRFRVTGVLLVAIANGRVRSVKTLYDRDELLRQIGVIAPRAIDQLSSGDVGGVQR